MVTIKCCKNCKDRIVGCHSICEKYIKEKEEIERVREQHARDIDSKVIYTKTRRLRGHLK